MAQQQQNQQTGTRDPHYNLVSVLYHALQGAETYAMYVRDAEQAGEQDLVNFFREVQSQEKQRADRAKKLLREHLAHDGGQGQAGQGQGGQSQGGMSQGGQSQGGQGQGGSGQGSRGRSS